MSDQNVSDSAAATEPGPVEVRKGRGGLWRWFTYILVALVAAGVAWLFTRGRGSEPKVGDCYPASAVSGQGSSADRLKPIACTDSQAAFKVVGIVDNKRAEEANLQDCTAQWPTTVEGMWYGVEGKPGGVLCLEPVEH